MDSYNYSPNGIDYDPDLLYPSPSQGRRQARREGEETSSHQVRRQAASASESGRRRQTRPDSKRRIAGSKEEKSSVRVTKSKKERVPVSEWGIVRFFADKRTRAVLGVALICMAVYIVIAAISYLRSGGEDQSAVVGRSASQIVAAGVKVHNQGGPLGASMSEIIFSQGLGLGSAVVLVYLVLLGLALMGIRKCNFWSMTFKSLLVGITVSMVLGLATLWFGTDLNLGGNHGLYMNRLIIGYADWIGAVLVSIVLVTAVVYVYLNDIARLISKYRSIKAARKAKEEQLAFERSEAEERVRQAMAASQLADDAAQSDDSAATHSEDSPGRPDEFGFDDSPADDTCCDDSDRDNGPLSGFDDIEREEDMPSTDDMPERAEYSDDNEDDEVSAAPDTAVPAEPAFEVYTSEIEKGEQTDTTLFDPTAELSRYQRPPLELLHERAVKANSVDLDEQEENKERITKTLNDYGIPISHIEATVGPTVTLYEIIPAEGVRIAKIKRLEDDIAMSLAALGIRIIAPIPGKGTIGIEVPNKDPQTVSIRSVLGSKAYQECKMRLPMAMGATISNEVYIADLSKMPHLLVAGATGMGKSVGLNTIIASLLYKKHPAELKFVLVDPKMVEFSLYSVLERHFLAKLPDEEEAVVTNMDKVVRTLNSLCVEMDQRYMLLRDANVRSITEYNERFVQKRLNPEKGHRYLPYIVMIVDEFCDLIMTAGKQVETPIARIAQKARAVGMHMIVATQRPSTNVITGIIKANFPGRIAFRVTQMVDSKTILDRTGANQLIGKGDMLFSHNGSMERVQCAFIDTDEVQAICDHIDSQVGYEHAYYLPEPLMTDDEAISISGSADRDPLFEEAAQIVVQTGIASTSNLQRRYSIGYNRAGKIMDQLEAAGIVGPSQGSKPRQVLVDSIQLGRITSRED